MTQSDACPAGEKEVACLIPAVSGNVLLWRWIWKIIESFSPFCWFEKGSCLFLALLMWTFNIRFGWEIRKNTMWIPPLIWNCVYDPYIFFLCPRLPNPAVGHIAFRSAVTSVHAYVCMCVLSLTHSNLLTSTFLFEVITFYGRKLKFGVLLTL